MLLKRNKNTTYETQKNYVFSNDEKKYEDKEIIYKTTRFEENSYKRKK